MKNVKNVIAFIALVSVLGIGNLYAADSTMSSPATATWYGNLYSYVAGYFTTTSRSTGTAQPQSEKLAANHNETLVRDEN